MMALGDQARPRAALNIRGALPIGQTVSHSANCGGNSGNWSDDLRRYDHLRSAGRLQRQLFGAVINPDARADNFDSADSIYIKFGRYGRLDQASDGRNDPRRAHDTTPRLCTSALWSACANTSKSNLKVFQLQIVDLCTHSYAVAQRGIGPRRAAVHGYIPPMASPDQFAAYRVGAQSCVRYRARGFRPQSSMLPTLAALSSFPGSKFLGKSALRGRAKRLSGFAQSQAQASALAIAGFRAKRSRAQWKRWPSFLLFATNMRRAADSLNNSSCS